MDQMWPSEYYIAVHDGCTTPSKAAETIVKVITPQRPRRSALPRPPMEAPDRPTPRTSVGR